MNYKLSKSGFCHGQICPKRLWLNEKKPSVARSASDHDKWLSQQGLEVEKLAQQLFSDGLMVKSKKHSFEQDIQLTKQHIQNEIKCLFQPAFFAEDVLVYCDILERQVDGSYHLYEVKSFSDDAKNIKSNDPNNFYINDLLIQVYILQKNGLKISQSKILYLNKKYVRKDQLLLDDLFSIYTLDPGELVKLDDVPEKISKLLNIIADETEYERQMGPHCRKPGECMFIDYCKSLLPEDSLLHTNIFHWETRQNLIATGQDRMSKLNQENSDVAKKMIAIKAEWDNEIYIDKLKITAFLNRLVYPLYLIDFECANFAIPRYAGYRPHDKVPFQFSLHVLVDNNEIINHDEFLWEHDSDPAEEFTENLCEKLSDSGSIIVYNQSYEASVIKQLAKRFSGKKDKLEAILSRMVDLQDPFKQQMCYLPKSRGFTSLKIILPLLCPDMSYDKLAIRSGDNAMISYYNLIESKDSIERRRIMDELKKYCCQDTLAMVKILSEISELNQ